MLDTNTERGGDILGTTVRPMLYDLEASMDVWLMWGRKEERAREEGRKQQAKERNTKEVRKPVRWLSRYLPPSLAD